MLRLKAFPPPPPRPVEMECHVWHVHLLGCQLRHRIPRLRPSKFDQPAVVPRASHQVLDELGIAFIAMLRNVSRVRQPRYFRHAYTSDFSLRRGILQDTRCPATLAVFYAHGPEYVALTPLLQPVPLRRSDVCRKNCLSRRCRLRMADQGLDP